MNHLQGTMDAFDNFFENAFQGTFADWGQRQVVTVDEDVDNDHIHISVGDNGITIDEVMADDLASQLNAILQSRAVDREEWR